MLIALYEVFVSWIKSSLKMLTAGTSISKHFDTQHHLSTLTAPTIHTLSNPVTDFYPKIKGVWLEHTGPDSQPSYNTSELLYSTPSSLLTPSKSDTARVLMCFADLQCLEQLLGGIRHKSEQPWGQSNRPGDKPIPFRLQLWGPQMWCKAILPVPQPSFWSSSEHSLARSENLGLLL